MKPVEHPRFGIDEKLRTLFRWMGPASLAMLFGATSCSTTTESSPPVPMPATTSELTSPSPTNEPEATVETTETTVGAPEIAGTIPLVGSYTAQIMARYPHDPTAFTQGLEFHDGQLLESTGQYGDSDRRWVDPTTGEILDVVLLSDEFFGEGITLVDDTVFQLTWKAQRVIRADRTSLGELTTNTYDGEGWGLCLLHPGLPDPTILDPVEGGPILVMSNGSSELTFRDPETFEQLGTVQVVDGSGAEVAALNELECVGGQVLANIYGLDVIVAIDAQTGSVDAVIDAAALRPATAPVGDFDYVLNGIAFNRERGTYFLTGKWWDTLYEVEFVAS